jgi:peptide methionine sulfoxide reductase MsrA
VDTQAPVIVSTKQNDDLGCNPTANDISSALGDATASDNCDAFVIVNISNGTPVNTGGCYWSQSRTFSAVDSCGNTATPVTVTVTWKVDTQAPVISASGQSVYVGCNPTQQTINAALGSALATDNCDASVIVTSTFGTATNIGGCYWSQSVTFTATDSCDNEAAPVSVTVTYKIDTQAPVITATGTNNFNLNCNPTTAQINAALGTASATDNCDASVVVNASTAAAVNTGGCYWSQTRTFTAVDSCTNTATPVSVTVRWKVDTQAPVITADNQNANLGCNPSSAQINAALGSASATDNCDASVVVNASTAAAVNTGGCYWSQTRTFTAVDSCSNSASSVSVTVTWKVDTQAPVITATGTNNFNLNCNPTTAQINAALGTASATDNCDASVVVNASTAAAVNTGGCYWSQTRTFTAVDSCTNTATPVSITVRWKVDTQAPVITADKSNANLGCNPSSAMINSYLGSATATDNCDASVIVNVSTAAAVNTGGCYWSQTRTFTAVDSCGNAATPVAVTVTWKVDITDPVITPNKQNSNLGCNPSAAAINTALGTATATDNCDASVIVNTSTGNPVNTTGCFWTITRTFTAIDSCGNPALPKSVVVTYKIDTIKPVITPSNANANLGCNPTSAALNAALGTATAVDNCDGNLTVSVYTSQPTPTTGCGWKISRTFNAVDACGNAAVTVKVTITYKIDTIKPVITATGTTLTLGCNPTSAAIEAALGTATATDNCDAVTPVATNSGITQNGCYRSKTRTWNVTDACGNAAVAVSRTVTWKVDLTAPVVVCNPGGNITVCAGTTVDLKPSANDNCDGPLQPVCTRSDNQPLSAAYPVGVTTVTCTATDACGNTGSCSITVTVAANPTCSITPPANLPAAGSTGNTLTSSSTNATSYQWSLVGTDPTGTPWTITAGATSPTVTYTAGTGIGYFKLVVTNTVNGVNCVDSCELMVQSVRSRYCTYTQGAYGNAGGMHCSGVTTPGFLTQLLSTPLVVGGMGTSNKLTLTAADVASGCFFTRLPGGGTSAKLLGTATCSSPVGIALNGTKFKNTLLVQTITMGLNLRIPGSTLGALRLTGRYLTTYDATGVQCSNTGLAIPGSGQVYTLPASVLNYLGANNTVADLYDLANRALAGTYTGTSPSLGQIASAIDQLNNAFDNCRIFGGFSTVAPAMYRDNDGLASGEENELFSVKAYPNPFTQKASIDFMLKGYEGNVTLEVFSLTGLKVATLYDGYAESDKKYSFEFDGETLKPGIYIYHLNTGDHVYTDKLILIKQ